jgi:hypothetical protein
MVAKVRVGGGFHGRFFKLMARKFIGRNSTREI